MAFDMRSAIIAVDFFSVLICIVLCYGNIFEAKNKNKSGIMYSIMVITDFVALISDALSYIFSTRVFFYLTNTLTMSLSLLLILEFIIFMGFYQNELGQQMKLRKINEYSVSAVLCLICLLITVFGCLNDWIFTYGENGEYIDGELFGVYLAANIITTGLALAIIIKNQKHFTSKISIAAIVYVLLPAIVAIINTLIPDFSFAYPACAISLLAFYILTQSVAAVKLETEKQQNRYHATHDALTGLYGRLAYQEKIEELEKSHTTVGVVFTDVNGLKIANDTMGHAAGDRLLIDYAEILTRVFTKDYVYRISGDEFVVIYEKGFKDSFEKIIEHFYAEIAKNEIASVGHKYGRGSDINNLISESENEMYIQKEQYHKAHPEMSR